jgi:hypothetical protein
MDERIEKWLYDIKSAIDEIKLFRITGKRFSSISIKCNVKKSY